MEQFIPYQFAYLTGSIYFLAVVIFFLWRIPGQKAHLLIFGFVYMWFGMVNEYFLFTEDWWHPLTLTKTRIGIEDAIATFIHFILPILLTAYLTKNNLLIATTDKKISQRFIIGFFQLLILLVILPYMLFFQFGYHSFNAINLTVFFGLIAVLLKRADLIFPAFLSGTFLVIFTLPMFIIGNLVFPNLLYSFWDFSQLSGKVFLYAPIEDLTFYFLWGSFITAYYGYLFQVHRYASDKLPFLNDFFLSKHFAQSVKAGFKKCQNKIHPLLIRFVKAIEGAPLTLGLFITSFISFVAVRLLADWLTIGKDDSVHSFFFSATHYFLEFLFTFILLLFLFRSAGIPSVKAIANVLLLQLFFVFLPPVLDTLIAGPVVPIYEFGTLSELLIKFITFFGAQSYFGITPGIRLGMLGAVAIAALYVFTHTKRVIKSISFAFLAYLIFFIISSFPAWITFLLEGPIKGFGAVTLQDQVSLFLTPFNLFRAPYVDFGITLHVKMSLLYGVFITFLTFLLLQIEFPAILRALIKNARIPQLIYHAGLLFLGGSFALIFTGTFFPLDLFHVTAILLLLIAVECAWLASVVVNDLYDIRIDAMTNPDRPLIMKTIDPALYKTIGFLFFAASLIFAGIVSFKALLLLLAYQAIAWLYSAPPLRLKRVPGIATLLAAAAGMLILMLGYLTVAPPDAQHIAVQVLFFLFFAYAVCLPLKDLKDLKGDKADHVYTIPVLLGEQNAKLFIGSAIFIMFALSPIVFRAPSLFFPSLIFASLTFWEVQKGSTDSTSRFSYHRLPGIVLGTTIIYGFIAAFLLLR